MGILAAFCVGSGLTWVATRAVPGKLEPSSQKATDTSPEKHPTNWPISDFSGIDMGDRLYALFNTFEPKLPIVKTVTYSSRTPWIKGKPAWLCDYASHYKTSKHFIACSLNRGPNYELQRVREGDVFNVLSDERAIRFHLIVDLSRAHMWLYAIDLENDEHLFLKNYPVSLGRLDSGSYSGSLTPIGIYALGERIGIYKRGKIGHYNGEPHEMIRTFGTRWIPFEKEISGCSAPARGLGVHGCPWRESEQGELLEDRAVLGTYKTDGCIQLAQEDMEKLFSIIITRPTTIEVVRDYSEAHLPGKPATCEAPLR